MMRSPGAEAGENHPRRPFDPVMDEWLGGMGVRVATHSLDRPRIVVKPRPAWLPFLAMVPAGAAPGRRSYSRPSRPVEIDPDEILPERDPEVATRLCDAGIRLATHSLDRPRVVVKRRPAWLAFLVAALRVRG